MHKLELQLETLNPKPNPKPHTQKPGLTLLSSSGKAAPEGGRHRKSVMVAGLVSTVLGLGFRVSGLGLRLRV